MLTDDNADTVYVERDYSFFCTFDDPSNITTEASVTTNQQWRKNGTVISETGPTLSFSPLRLSDAGQYICEVIVGSVTYCSVKDITLQSK